MMAAVNVATVRVKPVMDPDLILLVQELAIDLERVVTDLEGVINALDGSDGEDS